nr:MULTISPECIES: SgcJ/EcaC family oxidoreductase [unclassified Mycolicibacterium]
MRAVLDEWQTGVNDGDPHRVAEVFTEDAVFQGLKPYRVGRQGVHDYYASQPIGLGVSYRLDEVRTLAADVVLGYLRADFTPPGNPVVPLNIGVVVTRARKRWQIASYQVSPPVG